jgi:hypothetical protein
MKKFSVDQYIRALFRARPGRYRILVFLVTDQAFRQRDGSVPFATASAWPKGGLNILPKEVGEQPYSEDHVCTALVYEFKRVGSVEPVFVEPSEFNGQTHLQKSGLSAALQNVRRVP